MALPSADRRMIRERMYTLCGVDRLRTLDSSDFLCSAVNLIAGATFMLDLHRGTIYGITLGIASQGSRVVI